MKKAGGRWQKAEGEEIKSKRLNIVNNQLCCSNKLYWQAFQNFLLNI
ncbi:MAG: hypothetical protein AAGG00_08015 [Cyanobacteria bacterium P01_H01_bin.150]